MEQDSPCCCGVPRQSLRSRPSGWLEEALSFAAAVGKSKSLRGCGRVLRSAATEIEHKATQQLLAREAEQCVCGPSRLQGKLQHLVEYASLQRWQRRDERCRCSA